MKIGMLWFDNDPKKSLEEKIQDAVSHYKSKYNLDATMVYISNSVSTKPPEIPGLTVKKSRSILAHHFWIGRESGVS